MTERITLSGKPAVSNTSGAPDVIDPATGMHKDYWVLSEAERRRGFVRPVRDTYTHTTCGTNTSMHIAIAETYARDPNFYGSTFCAHCGTHFPVAQFRWKHTDVPVGT